MDILIKILLIFFILFLNFIVIKFFSSIDKISKRRRFEIYREMRDYFHSYPIEGNIVFSKAFDSIKKENENIADLKELWKVKGRTFNSTLSTLTPNKLRIKILNRVIENE